MSRHGTHLASPVFLWLLLAPPIEAGVLLTGATSASTDLMVCVSGGGCGGYSQYASGPLASVAYDRGFSSSPNGYIAGDVLGSASASASVGYGWVSAGATAVADYSCDPGIPGNCYFSGQAQGSASATLDDQITFFGSIGPGTIQYLVTTYSWGAGSATSNLPTAFVFGSPFDISATAVATSQMKTSGETDSFATFQLEGVRLVSDQDGSAITSFTYTTASGARYAAFDASGGVFAAPEPATLSLVFLDVLAMAGFRWSRRWKALVSGDGKSGESLRG